MAQHYKTATVFGGTGFLGRQIVRGLARRGVIVKVATRVPERAYFLKPSGDPGQVVPVACDYSNAQSVQRAIEGSDYVVNCIGILFQRGRGRNFKALHTDLPGSIASLCAQSGVKRLVHISALGVEAGTSRYAKTKFAGEKAVLENFPQATILRPSVIFGEGDHFFNMFAEMSRYLPFLPLIGGGKTRFQPVFVGDVAEAAMSVLEAPRARGQIYELGGPEILTFKEIYERLFKQTGRVRALVSLPFWAAKMQAFFMGFLPNPPLTMDQVESLRSDNIVKEGALRLGDLEIQPTALSVILPVYLQTYRRGGRFSKVQEA
ncbi:MAG: complex I NDUFA9 subunit family protein [Alphaproteobacteria bacterium]|nr:complex I NDUFA9 subunit family protein [Alphaproteobacteria bacterium]